MILQALLQQLGINQNRRKRVVDLVSHAGGHPSYGGDLLGLDELDIGVFQLLSHFEDTSHVREDSDTPDFFPIHGDDGGGEGDRDLIPILRRDGHARRGQFAWGAVLIASHFSHVLFGHVHIVKAAQVPPVDNFTGGKPGEVLHAFIENEYLAFGVQKHNAVYRALDHFFEERARLPAVPAQGESSR